MIMIPVATPARVGAPAAPPAPEAPRAAPEKPRRRVRPPRPRTTYAAPVELYRATDTVVVLAVLIGVFVAVKLDSVPHGIPDFLALRLTMKNLLLVCGFAVLWQLVFTALGLYERRVVREPRSETQAVVVGASLASAVALAIHLASGLGAFPAYAILYFWAAAIPATVLSRWLVRSASWRARARDSRNVIIVGSGPRAYSLFERIQLDPASRYQVLGFVDSNERIWQADIKQRHLGRLDRLEEILMHTPVDEVLIALPLRSCYTQAEEAIRTCERVGVESMYLADVFKCSLARPRYDSADDLQVVTLKVVADDIRLAAKRLIDIVGALGGLIVLSPVLLAIAVAIKLTSPGPVFFAQSRYGRNRRLFKMYKFRTMVPNAEALQVAVEHLNEAAGPIFKIKDDPRITTLGRFLRRTSLDELPQLFNVLCGEMSLVGPRPMSMRDVHLFPEAWLMRRFSVTPGLTCLWQIGGRSNLTFDDWISLDLQYIDNWSLRLDLQILLRTVPVVLTGKGAV